MSTEGQYMESTNVRQMRWTRPADTTELEPDAPEYWKPEQL